MRDPEFKYSLQQTRLEEGEEAGDDSNRLKRLEHELQQTRREMSEAVNLLQQFLGQAGKNSLLDSQQLGAELEAMPHAGRPSPEAAMPGQHCDSKPAADAQRLERLQEDLRQICAYADTLHLASQQDAGRLDAAVTHASRLQDALRRAEARTDKLANQLIETRRQLRIAQRKQHLLETQNTTLRESVSFKLGNALVEAVSSWKGALRLPLALTGALRQGIRVITRQGEGPGRQAPKPEAAPAPVKLPPLPDGSPKVACILDDFSFQCFAPECGLLQLHPGAWEKQLRDFTPDLLFVESAWLGYEWAWKRMISTPSEPLKKLVAWCEERNIPTAFWNKEDPAHFATFLNTARLFQHVFTTDLDRIPSYKKALGHERVHLLLFGCQPRLHNPVASYPRKDAVCFAGAYYAGYPERTSDLERFANALTRHKPLEIYDRNHGDSDPKYAFPDVYKPLIQGKLPFQEIDRAYKGYKYALNLNSIKQSQSMFARRVFELMACGTIVISNFSPGIRLLLGNLTLCSDDVDMLLQRLEKLDASPESAMKLRVAGLRKVLSQHTYAQRLRQVFTDCVVQLEDSPPQQVLVLAMADSEEQALLLQGFFTAQSCLHKRMLLVVPESVHSEALHKLTAPNLHCITQEQAQGLTLAAAAEDTTFIACFHPSDHYGGNYLKDLLLAAGYSEANAAGKAAHYVADTAGISLLQPEAAFNFCEALPARSSIFQASLAGEQSLLGWLQELDTRVLEQGKLFAADPCNYCQDALYRHAFPGNEVAARVDDDPEIDHGLDLQEYFRLAALCRPAESPPVENALGPQQLAELFGACYDKDVTVTALKSGLGLHSELAEGAHCYLYAPEHLPREFFGTGKTLDCHFEATPGLHMTLALLFLDKDRNRIGHAMIQACQNQTASVPPQTCWVRVGLRAYGPGDCEVRSIEPAHRILEPAGVLGRSDVLLLVNNYPSHNDLYRNAFVHARVKAYRLWGARPDIFRLKEGKAFSWHEFEDMDVASGTAQTLRDMLASGRYRHVLVHFLSPAMWDVLREFVDTLKVTVWIHGSEIHPWWRRSFDFKTREELVEAQKISTELQQFWKGLLNPPHPNLHLVFVSRHFSAEVMEDLDLALPPASCSIIHNPVDTELFAYEEKNPELRKRICSIRPFTSAKYANDLTVAAVEILSTKSFFRELHFCIIGDGQFFEDTVAPLRRFDNVELRKEFLSQRDMARLYRDYGVFLCPTRWDSQGVSRDEAMASGLAPVTSDCHAVPEFVDKESGMLAALESARELAEAIEKLYHDPMLFMRLSGNAARRVRSQSAKELVIPQEMALFAPEQDELVPEAD